MRLAVILFFALQLLAFAQEPTFQAGEAKLPAIKVEEISERVIKVGAITLDMNRKEISFPATYIPQRGKLEVLIGTIDSERLHETMFKTLARPYHLEYLLYILGADNTTPRKEKYKKGDLINIDVEWIDQAGKSYREPIESYILDTRYGTTMVRRGWYFPGSIMYKGHYQAEKRGNLCLVYSAPDTVLDNFDPKSFEDFYFEVNSARTKPHPKSSVRIIMSLREE